MAEVNTLDNVFLENYRSFIQYLDLSPAALDIAHVIVFALIITIIAIFIWQFYQSLSQKDLVKLNLRQYNRLEHGTWRKILAIFLYLVEYFIIMPFVILAWFAALAIIMLLIIEERGASETLMIAAALVASVRILSYYRKEISIDLAKLFPFITLSIFFLSTRAFNLERIVSKFTEIPFLLNNIFFFLIAIFLVEFTLRVFYSIYLFWQSEDKFEDIYLGKDEE